MTTTNTTAAESAPQARWGLLTPRDWQQDAIAQAAKYVGTTDYERFAVEALRYGLMADYMDHMNASLARMVAEVRGLREDLRDIIKRSGLDEEK